ncbi:unnamed protein product [Bathycoccus prasinos]
MSSSISSSSAEQSSGSASSKRHVKEPNWNNLWPIALAPVIPVVGIALKKHKQIRFPATFGIAGVILVWSHAAALGSSSGTK